MMSPLNYNLYAAMEISSDDYMYFSYEIERYENIRIFILYGKRVSEKKSLHLMEDSYRLFD